MMLLPHVCLALLLYHAVESTVVLQTATSTNSSLVQLTCVLNGSDALSSSAAAWTFQGSPFSTQTPSLPPGRYEYSSLGKGVSHKPLTCDDRDTNSLTGFTRNNWKCLWSAVLVETQDSFGPVLDYRWEHFPMSYVSPTREINRKINFNQGGKEKSHLLHFSVMAQDSALVYVTYGEHDSLKTNLITLDEAQGTGSAILTCPDRSSTPQQCSRTSATYQSGKVLNSEQWVHLTVQLVRSDRRVTMQLLRGTESLLQHVDTTFDGSLASITITLRSAGGVAWWKSHNYAVMQATSVTPLSGTFRYDRAAGDSGAACLALLYYSKHGDASLTSRAGFGAATNHVLKRGEGWQEARLELPGPADTTDYQVSITPPAGTNTNNFFALGGLRQCNLQEHRVRTLDVPLNPSVSAICTSLKSGQSDTKTLELSRIVRGRTDNDLVPTTFSTTTSSAGPSTTELTQQETRQPQVAHLEEAESKESLWFIIAIVSLTALVLVLLILLVYCCCGRKDESNHLEEPWYHRFSSFRPSRREDTFDHRLTSSDVQDRRDNTYSRHKDVPQDNPGAQFSFQELKDKEQGKVPTEEAEYEKMDPPSPEYGNIEKRGASPGGQDPIYGNVASESIAEEPLYGNVGVEERPHYATVTVQRPVTDYIYDDVNLSN